MHTNENLKLHSVIAIIHVYTYTKMSKNDNNNSGCRNILYILLKIFQFISMFVQSLDDCQKLSDVGEKQNIIKKNMKRLTTTKNANCF